jgi:hypothetical protein
MSAQDTERSAPAGTRHNPQDDRLLGTINASNTTSSEAAATAVAHHDRDWWRDESARLGSDWRSLLALLDAVIAARRARHDVSDERRDRKEVVCLTCGCDPCINPLFCWECRKVGARLQAERRSHQAESIPRDWDIMSIDALWRQFNRERGTPRTTIEAIMLAVKARGVAALKEPTNLERLSRCDPAARAAINSRVATLIAAKEIAA